MSRRILVTLCSTTARQDVNTMSDGVSTDAITFQNIAIRLKSLILWVILNPIARRLLVFSMPRPIEQAKDLRVVEGLRSVCTR